MVAIEVASPQHSALQTGAHKPEALASARQPARQPPAAALGRTAPDVTAKAQHVALAVMDTRARRPHAGVPPPPSPLAVR